MWFDFIWSLMKRQAIQSWVGRGVTKRNEPNREMKRTIINYYINPHREILLAARGQLQKQPWRFIKMQRKGVQDIGMIYKIISGKACDAKCISHVDSLFIHDFIHSFFSSFLFCCCITKQSTKMHLADDDSLPPCFFFVWSHVWSEVSVRWLKY